LDSRCTVAAQIISNFIKLGAPSELNISADLRDAVLTDFLNAVTNGAYNTTSGGNGSGLISESLFDKITDQLLLQLQSEHWPRFLESKYYEQALITSALSKFQEQEQKLQQNSTQISNQQQQSSPRTRTASNIISNLAPQQRSNSLGNNYNYDLNGSSTSPSSSASSSPVASHALFMRRNSSFNSLNGNDSNNGEDKMRRNSNVDSERRGSNADIETKTRRGSNVDTINEQHSSPSNNNNSFFNINTVNNSSSNNSHHGHIGRSNSHTKLGIPTVHSPNSPTGNSPSNNSNNNTSPNSPSTSSNPISSKSSISCISNLTNPSAIDSDFEKIIEWSSNDTKAWKPLVNKPHIGMVTYKSKQKFSMSEKKSGLRVFKIVCEYDYPVCTYTYLIHQL